MKQNAKSPYRTLADDLEFVVAERAPDQPWTDADMANARACWQRMPLVCKEIVVTLELAGHATSAARVEREFSAFLKANRQADMTANPALEEGYLEQARQRTADLVATLKALDRFVGRPALPQESGKMPPDDGSPFYPPAFFLKHFNISPDLLRKEKQRRSIRVVQPKPNVRRFHYSLPDAQRLWPHRFTDTRGRKP